MLKNKWQQLKQLAFVTLVMICVPLGPLSAQTSAPERAAIKKLESALKQLEYDISKQKHFFGRFQELCSKMSSAEAFKQFRQQLLIQLENDTNFALKNNLMTFEADLTKRYPMNASKVSLENLLRRASNHKSDMCAGVGQKNPNLPVLKRLMSEATDTAIDASNIQSRAERYRDDSYDRLKFGVSKYSVNKLHRTVNTLAHNARSQCIQSRPKTRDIHDFNEEFFRQQSHISQSEAKLRQAIRQAMQGGLARATPKYRAKIKLHRSFINRKSPSHKAYNTCFREAYYGTREGCEDLGWYTLEKAGFFAKLDRNYRQFFADKTVAVQKLDKEIIRLHKAIQTEYQQTKSCWNKTDTKKNTCKEAESLYREAGKQYKLGADFLKKGRANKAGSTSPIFNKARKHLFRALDILNKIRTRDNVKQGKCGKLTLALVEKQRRKVIRAIQQLPEICGDGKDNNMNKKIDENCQYKKSIVIDDNACDDDVMRLVIGKKDFGNTPAGHKRHYDVSKMQAGKTYRVRVYGVSSGGRKYGCNPTPIVTYSIALSKGLQFNGGGRGKKGKIHLNKGKKYREYPVTVNSEGVFADSFDEVGNLEVTNENGGDYPQSAPSKPSKRSDPAGENRRKPNNNQPRPRSGNEQNEDSINSIILGN